MKSVLLSLLAVVASSSAFALPVKDVKTVYTCQQSDGDLWYEVGVIPVGKGRLVLSLLQHDGDTGTIKSLYEGAVQEKKSAGKIVYKSARDVATLQIAPGRFAKGSFYLQEPGPAEAFFIDGLDCYENSTIDYVALNGLEPRMSVGN